MYQMLADTYNLSAEEREMLNRLGVESEIAGAGSIQWVADTIGGEAIDTYNNLALKLDAYNQPEKMQSYAFWYRTGTSPVPVVQEPDVLICPPQPAGCRRTMGRGMFPFWPVDERCSDCIRDSVMPNRQLSKVQAMGGKLRELLNMTGSQGANVPHLAQVIGELVALQGGPSGIAQGWNSALEELKEKGKPSSIVTQYNRLASFIERCNTMRQEELCALNELNDEELREYIARILFTKLSQETIAEILQESASLPQSEMGKLRDVYAYKTQNP